MQQSTHQVVGGKQNAPPTISGLIACRLSRRANHPLVITYVSLPPCLDLVLNATCHSKSRDTDVFLESASAVSFGCLPFGAQGRNLAWQTFVLLARRSTSGATDMRHNAPNQERPVSHNLDAQVLDLNGPCSFIWIPRGGGGSQASDSSPPFSPSPAPGTLQQSRKVAS